MEITNDIFKGGLSYFDTEYLTKMKDFLKKEDNGVKKSNKISAFEMKEVKKDTALDELRECLDVNLIAQSSNIVTSILQTCDMEQILLKLLTDEQDRTLLLQYLFKKRQEDEHSSYIQMISRILQISSKHESYKKLVKDILDKVLYNLMTAGIVEAKEHNYMLNEDLAKTHEFIAVDLCIKVIEEYMTH